MNLARPLPPLLLGWSDQQRLIGSVALAVLLHLLLVFGIDFESDPVSPRTSLPTLEILLTPYEPSPEEVKNAEFLSQASHQDETREPEKVEEQPELIEQIAQQAVVVPVVVPEVPPEPPKPVVARPVLPEPAIPRPVVEPKPTEPPKASAATEVRPVVQKLVTKPGPEKVAPPAPVVTSPISPGQYDAPQVANLLARSLAMAQLSAEVEDAVSSYASLPRQRHISASTREYKYAAYMDAWVKKVERMGNLNYPAQARKENLTGSLILDVSLRPSGQIESIEFVKSSGFKILDDAAVNIVRMSAPFAMFPENIREETDLLHITRTWQFVHGNRLSGF